MLDEPESDLTRSLFVMNFSDEEWTLHREKVITAAQNVVFTAFYINFDQLRYRSAVRDEIVQRDRRYINQLSASENGALSVHLNAAVALFSPPLRKEIPLVE